MWHNAGIVRTDWSTTYGDVPRVIIADERPRISAGPTPDTNASVVR